MLPAWWDWDISARARIASLASAWLLVAFAWAPLAILVPLGLVRFSASFAQTLWNHQLDRVQPLGPRSLIDWGMLALALAASTAVAAVDRSGLAVPVTLAFSAVLLPLSVIQVRAAQKSIAAHRRARAAVTTISRRVTASPGKRHAA